MKKLILISITSAIFFLFTAFTPADVCDNLIFFKEGTILTMTSYTDDGKVTGSTKTSYTKTTKTPTEISVSAFQESFDKKGKSTFNSEFTVKCAGGNLVFDMKMMVPQQQQEAYKDMEMTMDGTDLEMPSNLQVGNTLKDAHVNIKVSAKGGAPIPMMNMSVRITERKVEAKESTTTPAGTFECYKISEWVETKSIVGIKMKSVQWFSFEAGVVKTETYKENGKYMGKTELTEIKK